ncbi:PAS domain-containing protein [bacterium]|nr:PAS domain-containing protein [bacterium]
MMNESQTQYKTLLETLPQKVFYKDRNSVWISCNMNMASDLGLLPEEVTGKSDFDLFPKELAEKYSADDKEVMDSGETREIEEKYIQDGEERWVNTIKKPVKNEKGAVTGVLGIFWDITDRKRSEAELAQHREHLEQLVQERTAALEKINEQLKNEISAGKQREEIISRQNLEILELSTPVLQIMDGVVVAPLIGTIDSERTQRFMERFLGTIVKTNSPVALMDITGVPTLDTQTAQHLIEAVTAATLLGTKVIVTGVSPAIAQTLVHLGVDLTDITTKSSLSAGLRTALEFLNMEIASKKGS